MYVDVRGRTSTYVERTSTYVDVRRRNYVDVRRRMSTSEIFFVGNLLRSASTTFASSAVSVNQLEALLLLRGRFVSKAEVKSLFSQVGGNVMYEMLTSLPSR